MDTQEVFFKDADGKIYPVRLPSIDAAFGAKHHPHEWSYEKDKFAPRRKGFEAGEPVGADKIVGLTGGSPDRTDRLGVLGPSIS